MQRKYARTCRTVRDGLPNGDEQLYRAQLKMQIKCVGAQLIARRRSKARATKTRPLPHLSYKS